MSGERSAVPAAGTVMLWVLTVVMAGLLGFAGLAKFAQSDLWTGLFAGWGYPTWLSYVVGALELAGAVGLLVPRLATYAGALLVAIMIAAAYTVLTNPGDMGAVPPAVNIVGLAIVAYARRKDRWMAA